MYFNSGQCQRPIPAPRRRLSFPASALLPQPARAQRPWRRGGPSACAVRSPGGAGAAPLAAEWRPRVTRGGARFRVLPPPENVSVGAGGCWSRRRHFLLVPARLLLPCSPVLLSCPPPVLPLPPPPGGERPPGREGRGPDPGSPALRRVRPPTSGAWAG